MWCHLPAGNPGIFLIVGLGRSSNARWYLVF